MKKLDKFILKSFLGPFFGILIVVVFILMLQFLWLYIDELVGKGLGLKIIMEFLGWGSATMLPLSLPLATLLASVMTVGQMAENNELIAMKSAGISLNRVLRPLIVSAVVISVLAFFAVNNLVPVAYNKIYTLREDIGKTKEEINIPTGTFYDGIDGYVLRIESKNDKSGIMHGVMVYDHTSGKGNTSVTLADSAMLKMSQSKDYLTFQLFSGINYQETNNMSYRDTSLQLQKITFSQQDMIIPLQNYAFKKTEQAKYGDQVRAMNIKQLKHGQDSLNHLNDSARVKNTGDFLAKRVLRRANQLDTAVNFASTTEFDHSKLSPWKDKNEELRAYEAAAAAAEDYRSITSGYENDVYSYMYILRRSNVEFLKKFAEALACFILFFIGAPLGAFIRKGGLGVSAIIAVLFFVLYWVVDITGTKLAKDGAISAAAGVFVSTIVLFPIGMYFTWKAINDSALFNTDNFGSWWRKIKSKFMSTFRKTRIVYMGTPEFAVAPLKALLDAKYNVVGVVTVADKPSGRGLKVNESAVKKFAVENNIPVLQPVKLKDPEFLKQLADFKADLFVVVAFRMLPEEVWAMPKLGTFNLHAALLPQYRGAAPINWAVINGEKMSGVTTFMIDKDIDTGGIMLRQECRIAETDTAGDLHDKLMPIGADLVVQTVEGIIEKNIETRVQRSFIQGSEVLKSAPKLTRELCHIDWNDSTRSIYNLIRGLSPYPAAFTELVPAAGGAPVQLKIYAGTKVEGDEFRSMLVRCGVGEGISSGLSSEPSNGSFHKNQDGVGDNFAVNAKEGHTGSNIKPGQILSDGKSFFAITTADGAISLTDLQLAGKKRMEVKPFLAGFRNPSEWETTLGTSKEEIAKTRK